MTVEQCKNIATMVKRTPAAQLLQEWQLNGNVAGWVIILIIIRDIAQFALLISTLG